VNQLSEYAAERGIKYFMVSFTDLRGVQRAKLVPAASIDRIASEGAGFAGFATWLDMTPADADMLALADRDSVIQLPWKPEVAWLTGDLVMSGKPVEQAPRRVLQRQIQRAAERGYRVCTGVECEFFVLSSDGSVIGDGADVQSKPCYDQQALMRRYDLIAQICDHMLALGWGPYQNDHEDANGQFEMNWTFSDALTTADRHSFFKYMVKTLAERHGLRATFMPKPFRHLTGNGCHVHASVWDADGERNLFHDEAGELGLSKLAYGFLGGVMNGADELCAVFNPTVNSYKRINAPATLSGATWAPNAVSYSGNNRTHLVRIPDAGRLELRLLDGATNPYLAQAAVLLLGQDGMRHGRDPGPRLECNMYTEGQNYPDLKRLPLNLLDAIRLFEGSALAREGFGEELVKSYAKLKHGEWGRYCGVITDWERETTLDC
jgi:glutamate---methylamine ligase